MSDCEKVSKGLQIFLRHGGKYCAAEHDILYSGQGDCQQLDQTEVNELIELGWFITTEFCNGKCIEVDGENTPCAIPILNHKPGETHLATCNQWAFFT